MSSSQGRTFQFDSDKLQTNDQFIDLSHHQDRQYNQNSQDPQKTLERLYLMSVQLLYHREHLALDLTDQSNDKEALQPKEFNLSRHQHLRRETVLIRENTRKE